MRIYNVRGTVCIESQKLEHFYLESPFSIKMLGFYHLASMYLCARNKIFIWNRIQRIYNNRISVAWFTSMFYCTVLYTASQHGQLKKSQTQKKRDSLLAMILICLGQNKSVSHSLSHYRYSYAQRIQMNKMWIIINP